MKSRFFTDTQALDTAPHLGDRVSLCVLMRRDAVEQLLHRSRQLHLSTGEYLSRLVTDDAIPPSMPKSPSRRFPPAPPGH